MDISVIIPTLANSARGESLARALLSLEHQEGCRIRPIVVVNGKKFDRDVLDQLARRDLILINLPEASLPGALAAGAAAVKSEFFGFLDDDDEYLPHAVSVRLKAIDGYDVVATGGYEVWDDKRVRIIEDVDLFRTDPLFYLFQKGNWLASCGALYRTSSVSADVFADLPRYLEWTYLAAKLCSLGKHINIVSTPTFLINKGETGSLSTSVDYKLQQPVALSRILDLPLPKRIRAILRKKISAALHLASEAQRRNGHLRSAWAYHLQCLNSWHGVRYLPYTRHLLKDALGGRNSARCDAGEP